MRPCRFRCDGASGRPGILSNRKRSGNGCRQPGANRGTQTTVRHDISTGVAVKASAKPLYDGDGVAPRLFASSPETFFL